MPLAADRALASVVARFAIPRAVPEALLEGFAWDPAGRRYADAGGAPRLCRPRRRDGRRHDGAADGRAAARGLARACDLGVAMQLSNIARDVGEDARAGRLYLPQEWLREAGHRPRGLARRPVFTPGLAGVVRRLWPGGGAVPRSEPGSPGCRCPAARHRRRALVYAEIGREVARQGFDSISRRAVCPARKCG